MNKEQIKKIIDSSEEYDESQEVTMRSWLKDAFSKRMRLVFIWINVMYLIIFVLVIFCAIKFFRADQIKSQIMYATLFVSCCIWCDLVSIWGVVMMQRPSITREIKRLELRIAELAETVKNK